MQTWECVWVVGGKHFGAINSRFKLQPLQPDRKPDVARPDNVLDFKLLEAHAEVQLPHLRQRRSMTSEQCSRCQRSRLQPARKACNATHTNNQPTRSKGQQVPGIHTETTYNVCKLSRRLLGLLERGASSSTVSPRTHVSIDMSSAHVSIACNRIYNSKRKGAAAVLFREGTDEVPPEERGPRTAYALVAHASPGPPSALSRAHSHHGRGKSFTCQRFRLGAGADHFPRREEQRSRPRLAYSHDDSREPFGVEVAVPCFVCNLRKI